MTDKGLAQNRESNSSIKKALFSLLHLPNRALSLTMAVPPDGDEKNRSADDDKRRPQWCFIILLFLLTLGILVVVVIPPAVVLTRNKSDDEVTLRPSQSASEAVPWC